MNISKTTKSYIDKHQHIKDCLRKGIINYSALARKIARKLNIEGKGNFDAILVACRRYAEELNEKGNERKNIKLLEKSKIQIKTNICRLILKKGRTTLSELGKLAENLERNHTFQIIQGESAITIIIDEENLKKVRKKLKNNIVDVRRDLAEITVISPEKVDMTIGITSFLSSLLSDRGINILSTLGSYRDDIFILKHKDINKALDVFNKF